MVLQDDVSLRTICERGKGRELLPFTRAAPGAHGGIAFGGYRP